MESYFKRTNRFRAPVFFSTPFSSPRGDKTCRARVRVQDRVVALCCAEFLRFGLEKIVFFTSRFAILIFLLICLLLLSRINSFLYAHTIWIVCLFIGLWSWFCACLFVFASTNINSFLYAHAIWIVCLFIGLRSWFFCLFVCFCFHEIIRYYTHILYESFVS